MSNGIGPTTEPIEKESWLSRLFSGSAESDKRKLAVSIRGRRLGAMEPHDYEGLMPMAGTTRFLASGVPDVAARVAATNKFIEAMKGLGPKAEEAATLFAERYPRVAAHMRPVGQKMMRGLRGVADVDKPLDQQVRVRLSTTPRAVEDIESTLLHEGTHVAQRLGNPKTYDMYAAYNRALSPSIGENAAYLTNPFERSANTVALRKLGHQVEPVKALDLMRKAVEQLPAGSPERINLARSMQRY